MRRIGTTVTLLAATTLLFALAQEVAGPVLTVAEDPEWGQYLADSQGMSLYVYAMDEGGESACTSDKCMENWPPYTVDGDVTVADGINSNFAGTYERPDGSIQVTYNGWPLYYNERDQSQGDIRGQALGDVFHLMSPVGNAITDRPSEAESPDPAEAEQEGREQAEEGEGDAAEADGQGAANDQGGQQEGEGQDQQDGGAQEGQGAAPAGQGEATQALMEQGQTIFSSNCSSCHGAEGQGLVGPALAGNRYLQRTEGVITTILGGRPEHGMPSFAGQLDDQQIAAVATFIRNSWGNSFGPVTPEQVAEQR